MLGLTLPFPGKLPNSGSLGVLWSEPKLRGYEVKESHCPGWGENEHCGTVMPLPLIIANV